MTMKSYSLGIRRTPDRVAFLFLNRFLALQRGQRDEGGAGGARRRAVNAGRQRLGIQTVAAPPQLPMLEAKPPVGRREPLQPLGQPARPGPGRQRHDDRRTRKQPVKGQQTSYLIERLATVSTA